MRSKLSLTLLFALAAPSLAFAQDDPGQVFVDEGDLCAVGRSGGQSLGRSHPAELLVERVSGKHEHHQQERGDADGSPQFRSSHVSNPLKRVAGLI